MPPCATSNTTPTGSRCCSPRMHYGKALVWAGSKGARRSGASSEKRRIFSFAIHYSLNGPIEVEGDTGQAQWYLFMPCTVTAGNQAMWRASIDHETCVRVDGVWMFRHKRSEPLMNVPFETGWAKGRFM